MIPYVSDEQADAVTKNPQLKLVFRLLSFAVLTEGMNSPCQVPPLLLTPHARVDADELEWYVPARLVPEEMQRHLNVISQFLENPIDLGGKAAASLLQRNRRKRRRRARSPTPSEGEGAARGPCRRPYPPDIRPHGYQASSDNALAVF